MDFISQIGTAALDNALSIGLLVAAVWWFSNRDKKHEERIEELNTQKDELQKEMRDAQERNLTRTIEAINNNTTAFNALRDALRNG